MTACLTFWACGGEVIATHGRVIAADEARRLHAFYLTAADGSDDATGQCDARELADELGRALDAATRWRRAGLAPYSPAPVLSPAYERPSP